MKKYIYLTALIFITFSCKRIYQCECKQVINYEDWNQIVTSFPIEDNSEKDAKAFCVSSSNDFGQGNYKNCSLK